MAGEIVHIEIPATNVDRAQGFWSGLFGWEFGGSVMEGFEYRMARINDTSGAALMQSEEPGHPNYYYDTPDIDASITKVKDLGGEAGDKTPVPTHGWFSACKDTEGNTFFLWQNDTNAA
ncbi:MAG TPA: VOC family protein [Gaiellaceae bacterium]|jgi:uncharacterized protein